MENIIAAFTKIAPAIVERVKAQINQSTTDQQIGEIIHREILAYFERQNAMAVEYLTFGQEDRATFAALMYEITIPLAAKFKHRVKHDETKPD